MLLLTIWEQETQVVTGKWFSDSRWLKTCEECCFQGDHLPEKVLINDESWQMTIVLRRLFVSGGLQVDLVPSLLQWAHLSLLNELFIATEWRQCRSAAFLLPCALLIASDQSILPARTLSPLSNFVSLRLADSDLPRIKFSLRWRSSIISLWLFSHFLQKLQQFFKDLWFQTCANRCQMKWSLKKGSFAASSSVWHRPHVVAVEQVQTPERPLLRGRWLQSVCALLSACDHLAETTSTLTSTISNFNSTGALSIRFSPLSLQLFIYLLHSSQS